MPDPTCVTSAMTGVVLPIRSTAYRTSVLRLLVTQTESLASVHRNGNGARLMHSMEIEHFPVEIEINFARSIKGRDRRVGRDRC